MIKVGINGLGRIGKSILTQCLKEENIKISAINFPNYKIDRIKSYLSNDSVHKEVIDSNLIEIIGKDLISICGNQIRLLNNREPKENMWNNNDVEYLFDTTGKFLTNELAKKQDAKYLIMCAPSKDKTPQYLFNGNHNKYVGENIISASSCTTNCIVPFLKLIDERYQIESSNFITVHSATASQNVIDGVHLKNRSHRSVFNNIIPHTTGASKSAIKILPKLEGKLFGSSVRVPTVNVSMVDINIKLKNEANLNEILSFLRSSNEVIINDDKYLVSSDFTTTKNPTIIDSNSCMPMGKNEFKFTIWYDNEWSYSAQAIKLVKIMYKYNNSIIYL